MTDKYFCATQSASQHFLEASLQLQPPESTMNKVVSSHTLLCDTVFTFFRLHLSTKPPPLVNVTDIYWCLARCLYHYSYAKPSFYIFLPARVLTMVLKSAAPIKRLHTEHDSATQYNRRLIHFSVNLSDIVPRHRRLSSSQFDFVSLVFCHFVSNYLLFKKFQSSIFVSQATVILLTFPSVLMVWIWVQLCS